MIITDNLNDNLNNNSGNEIRKRILKRKIQTILTLDFYEYHNDPELLDLFTVFQSVYYCNKHVVADNYESLYYAIHIKNLKMVKFLVSHCESSVNKVIITRAIISGYLDIVKFLANSSNILEYHLRFAVKRGYFEIVKYLVSKGYCKPSFRSVRYAVECGHIKLVKYLVSREIHVAQNDIIQNRIVQNNVKQLYIAQNTTNMDIYMSLALRNHYFEIVKYFISIGMTLSNDIFNSVFSLGLKNHDNMIKYLISENINLSNFDVIKLYVN